MLTSLSVRIPLLQIAVVTSLIGVPWSVHADVITGGVSTTTASSTSVPAPGEPARPPHVASSLFDASGGAVLRVSATPAVSLTDATVFKLSPEYVVNFFGWREKLRGPQLGNVSLVQEPIIFPSVPAAVPEPSTLLLLASGLAVAVRRLKARGQRPIGNPHL